MISIYNLKPRFQKILRPLCAGMVEKGITPNNITIGTAVLSVFTGLLLVLFNSHHSFFFIMPFFMLLRMALNAMDGIIAKEFDMKTRQGAIYNELGDVISDVFLYLPFAFLPQFNSTFVFLIIILAVITEMSGILAFSIGSQRAYDGPMGKSDRAFVFSLLAVAVGFEIHFGMWLHIIWIGLTLLMIYTIHNRIKTALR